MSVSAVSVGLTIAHASAVGLFAPQFVKDTELEGGNVAAALETFVAMMREAVQEPTLPVGDGGALQAAVDEAAGLILDSATSCRRLRKASSIKKFRDALVWYQRRLLALKVRGVCMFAATDPDNTNPRRRALLQHTQAGDLWVAPGGWKRRDGGHAILLMYV